MNGSYRLRERPDSALAGYAAPVQSDKPVLFPAEEDLPEPPSIEDDLSEFAQDRLDLSHAELTHQCEMAIRDYDPCISCATHFLELEVQRT